MVKGTTPTMLMSTTLNSKNSKTLHIEEKSTKPPGSSRFSRKKHDTQIVASFGFDSDVVNVAELCQQLLVSGFVQSYVDFYHLTHRLDPTGADRGSKQIQISRDDMLFIRDNLVKAEVSRRQGDTPSVYSSFNKLADYYVARQDWKTSLFFHEKCLEVAQLTNDVRAEMAANHSLGGVHQLMFDYNGSRRYHERHEEIAASIDVFEEIAKANVELYKVYTVLAESMENAMDLEGALEMYIKTLEAAKKSWDRASEGEANGKIGMLLLNRCDAEQCLPYLRQQSQISADLGNAEGRCRACSALAYALDMLGQADKALNELTLVHSISEQAGDIHLQAHACKSLGTLYSKVGKLDAAVDILQKHFNLLKTILFRSSSGVSKQPGGVSTVTARDLDLARLFIGISKGNMLMGAYVVALQLDWSALLDWKLDRTELPNPATLLNHAKALANK